MMTDVAKPPVNLSGPRYREAHINEIEFAKREITLIAVPYNQEAEVFDWGSGATREKFMPGAFKGIESRTKYVTLNRDHLRERVIGVAKNLDTRNEQGLIATFKVSDTPLGSESLRLAADGVLRASVAFQARSRDREVTDDGLVIIHRAFLIHVALTPEPAYEGAEVLDVREDGSTVEPATPRLDEAAAILRRIQNL